MSKFVEGNKVTIWRHHQPCAITTVQRITARKMVLGNGSEWTADGWRPWGAGRGGYSTSHVNHFKDQDAETLKRRVLMSKINTQKWSEISTAKLARIVQILKESSDD